MFDKLDSIEKRFSELEAQLSDPAVMQDMKKYSELMKEHATSKEIVDSYALYKKTVSQLEEAKEMAGSESDPELKEMADEITLSNNDDGIAASLTRHFDFLN